MINPRRPVDRRDADRNGTGLWLAMLVGVGAAAWSIYLVHSIWGTIGLSDLTRNMSEKGGAVEAGREAGGLAIEAVWLLFACAFRRWRA